MSSRSKQDLDKCAFRMSEIVQTDYPRLTFWLVIVGRSVAFPGHPLGVGLTHLAAQARFLL